MWLDTATHSTTKTCSLTAPEVREYWKVRHRLSVDDILLLLNQRIIILTPQHTKVLCSLHLPRHISNIQSPRGTKQWWWTTFMSLPFKQFLEDWAVKNRLSSTTYLQFNGWVVLTIKSAKRIVNGNKRAQGSLDNDCAARAILQYTNMPIQNIEPSPAQLLLHHQLHNFIPSQPTLYKPHANWIAATQNHEMSRFHQKAYLIEQYNCIVHTLFPFQKGQNSCNTMTKHPWMGQKKSSHWNPS